MTRKKILLSSAVILVVGGVIITGLKMRSEEPIMPAPAEEQAPLEAPIIEPAPTDSLYAPEYSYNETTQRYRVSPVDAAEVDVKKITNTAILQNVFGDFFWTVARPIYIEKLPADFGKYGDYLLYTQSILPLILRENKQIIADRDFLLKLVVKWSDNLPWTPEEQVGFDALTKKYDTYQQKVTDAQIAELLERVNTIPPSLAIAMSAVQTNWGQQNTTTLFGQKAWIDGKYVFKPFDTLPEAVHGYMMELNTLPQYKTMRMRRGVYRNLRGSLGLALADEMSTFMPDDSSYVDKIKAMYKSNDLAQLDGAILDE